MDSASQPKEKSHRIRWLAAFLLGIVAPLVFLRLEWKTHCLSGCGFDPMPTLWHFGALIVVPLANSFVLFGAGSSVLWIRCVASFLRWPALIISAFFCAAMGITQVYALLFSPLFVGWWVMEGLPWPDDSSDRLGVESAICVILTITPLLTLVGWGCLQPCSRRCGEAISQAVRRKLAQGGIAFTLLLIIGMELPMVRAFAALRAYAEGETDGAVPALLLHDSNVAILSRLIHSPRQFSSDGLLDCEGPVDAFGPAVHMLNGWASSTEMWSRFTGKYYITWSQLMEKIKRVDSNVDTTPRSWRRLSPWERWEIRGRAKAK